ncbi:zinc finger HIT domain-containing protein 2 [Tachyglossus aculeatus]|uniref:zinc finger HIT domain-containing protein 2 n=1 Tax=Tachyglossus aculeatus TaxID=9261 RepID=UPI0018F6D60A|nr:zinc finger HIT domain-containing protein 2 [Tachyglossus aculeatus]
MEAEGAAACGLCPPGRARASRYTCPRCNVAYCSVPCYRAHGACAEAFYRDQVVGHLRGGRASSPGRLARALRRLRRQRQDDPGRDLDPSRDLDPDDLCPSHDPDIDDLDPGLDLDPAELWAQLGPAEKAAFERLLRRGEAGGLLPPWRPWWWGAGGGGPPVPPDIPPLAALTRGRPSPLLRFQLPNVLFAYAHALALYHGDDDLVPDVCATVLAVSEALGSRRVFSSTAEALGAAARALEAGEQPPGPLGPAGAARETSRLLLGEDGAGHKGYALAALGHLAGALGRARRLAPGAEERERLYRARKKCRFLLSWTNENQEALRPLALECGRARRERAAEAEEVAALAGELERRWGGPTPPARKTLIEELS